MDDIVLDIAYKVTAYDESGYGDNRSCIFTNGNEAVEYAKSLPGRFGAVVYKHVTMRPIVTKVFP